MKKTLTNQISIFLFVFLFLFQSVYAENLFKNISINNTDWNLWNNHSLSPSISADGKYVVFSSEASNLVVNDTNGVADIFVSNTDNWNIERISVNNTWEESNAWSYEPSISADGRYVVFSSEASNLVVDDTNGLVDVFIYDIQNRTIKRVSVDDTWHEADWESRWWDISADGKLITFVSNATNLVPNDLNWSDDIFLYSMDDWNIERISVDNNWNEGNWNSYDSVISVDGKYIVFTSQATNLVLNDSNWVSDVFIYNIQTWDIERISVDNNWNEGNWNSYSPSISTNGKIITFVSNATNLVVDDTNTFADIFMKNLGENTLDRVSVNNDQSQSNQDSYNPNISADGKYIIFMSKGSNLVTGDTNWVDDVFLYNVNQNKIQRVSFNDTTLQQADGFSYTPVLSENWRFFGFSTNAVNLTSVNDNNSSLDIVVASRMPKLSLYWSSTMVILQWSSWQDPWALWEDPIDGDLSFLSSSWTVNTALPWTYVLTYSRATSDNKFSATRLRTVIVSPVPWALLNSWSILYINSNPPIITGTGNSWNIITIFSWSNVFTGLVWSTGSWSINLTGAFSWATIYTLSWYITNVEWNTGQTVPFSFIIDTIAPVVSLSGASNMSINQNSTFIDPWARWTDAIDISWSILTGTASWNILNTAVLWTYYLKYTHTDRAGNTGNIVTRTVSVVPVPSNTTPSYAWGGWGWGWAVRDNCPVNEDYSPSYYDGTCGTKTITSSGSITDSEVDSLLNEDEINSSWFPRPIPLTNISSSQQAMNNLCEPYSEDGYSMELYNSSKVYKKEIFIICWMSENKLSKFNKSSTFRWNDILRKDESTKFLYNFMTNVLDFTPTKTKTDCNYNDLANGHADLWWYITNACKIWLYNWSNVSKSFNPADKLSAGNVSTLFSKVTEMYNNELWEEEYSIEFLKEIKELWNKNEQITRMKAAHALYQLSQLI